MSWDLRVERKPNLQVGKCWERPAVVQSFGHLVGYEVNGINVIYRTHIFTVGTAC